MPTMRGVIRGRTIELDKETSFTEGQEVLVQVEPVIQNLNGDAERRSALERAAGSWSDDAEGLERFLGWNRQQRKINRPEIS